jgi:hypothetical protein
MADSTETMQSYVKWVDNNAHLSVHTIRAYLGSLPQLHNLMKYGKEEFA